MDIVETIKTSIDWIGDKIPELTEKALGLIQDAGMVTNTWTARLVSIGILALIFYLIIRLGQNLKPLIQWILKIVTVLLIISIIFATFIGNSV